MLTVSVLKPVQVVDHKRAELIPACIYISTSAIASLKGEVIELTHRLRQTTAEKQNLEKQMNKLMSGNQRIWAGV